MRHPMPDPYKGFGALRKGRHSSPGADYFLTICLQRPSSVLNQTETGRQCLSELLRLQEDQALTLRCEVTMPDHLHLLISLGQYANLSSVVRLFKGRLTPLLRRYEAAWQESFYDHCLHSEEDLLPVFLYIFLNPYRKKLLPLDQVWPWYYTNVP